MNGMGKNKKTKNDTMVDIGYSSPQWRGPAPRQFQKYFAPKELPLSTIVVRFNLFRTAPHWKSAL